MCNVLLPPGVNPVAVNKYIITIPIGTKMRKRFGNTMLPSSVESFHINKGAASFRRVLCFGQFCANGKRSCTLF
jgi:hypothetical protein